MLHFRRKAIAGRDQTDAFVAEHRHETFPAGESSAVQPDEGGETGFPGRQPQVHAALLLPVGIRFGKGRFLQIGDVFLFHMGGKGGGCHGEEQDDWEEAFHGCGKHTISNTRENGSDAIAASKLVNTQHANDDI